MEHKKLTPQMFTLCTHFLEAVIQVCADKEKNTVYNGKKGMSTTQNSTHLQ